MIIRWPLCRMILYGCPISRGSHEAKCRSSYCRWVGGCYAELPYLYEIAPTIGCICLLLSSVGLSVLGSLLCPVSFPIYHTRCLLCCLRHDALCNVVNGVGYWWWRTVWGKCIVMLWQFWSRVSHAIIFSMPLILHMIIWHNIFIWLTKLLTLSSMRFNIGMTSIANR